MVTSGKLTNKQRVKRAAVRRAFMVMMVRMGFKPEEIAEALGVSPTIVWRHLARAGVAVRRSAADIWPGARPPYWELHKRNGVREVVCGRKYCPGCGRWRHVCDFPPVSSRAVYRSALPARCMPCRRASARYYLSHITPERRERLREYARIWSDSKRREEGKAKRSWRGPTVIDNREGIYFPVAPLRAELERLGDGEFYYLAERAGVPERTIYRLRYSSTKVQIDVADKLAVALGTTSALLFGDAWFDDDE